MASKLAYLMEFRDSFDRTVSVKIYSQTHIGDPYVLTGASDPLIIKYKGSDDDPFQDLISSDAVINFIAKKEDVSGLYNITERQYLVIIECVPNTVPSLLEYRWVGFLSSDGLSTGISYQESQFTLTATCLLNSLKGRLYSYANNLPITGAQNLGYLFDFSSIVGDFSDIALSYTNKTVNTNISLSSDYQSPFYAGFGLDMEGFLTDDGKAVSHFEAIQTATKAFFMKGFYEDGGYRFIDILNHGIDPVFPVIAITYNEHPDTNIDDDGVLLDNAEDITKLPTYKETSCKFEYKNILTILENGMMQRWTAVSGGYTLDGFTTSGIASPHLRRQGRGRAENPYGFRIDSYTEAIATKTTYRLRNGDKGNLSIDYRLLFPTKPETSLPSYAFIESHRARIGIVAYNHNNPEFSAVLIHNSEGELMWFPADLTGTSFATTYDFSVTSAPFPSGAVPTTTDIIREYYIPASGGINTLDINIPSLFPTSTEDLDYTVHVGVYGFFALANNGTTVDVILGDKALIHNIKFDLEVEENGKGEVAYVTRYGDRGIAKLQREIGLQTSKKHSTGGALRAMIPYSIAGDTFPAGYLDRVFRFGDTNQMNVTLTDLNAISMMWLSSFGQYKIECTVRLRTPLMRARYDLSRLYNPFQMHTIFYLMPFVASSMEWNVKSGNTKLILFSNQKFDRPWSIIEETSTIDLLENYIYR